MKNIAMFIFVTILLIIVSCEFTKNRMQSGVATLPPSPFSNEKKTAASADQDPSLSANTLASMQQGADQEQIEQPTENPSPARGPVTQYDSKALDDRVRDMAKTLNQDPKTYRLLLERKPDGTEIFRMIGMHVIKNPNGEEVFLPDEL